MADTNNVASQLGLQGLSDLAKAAQQTSQTATQYSQAAALLPTKLKQALQEKLLYNKDIIDQQTQSRANVYSAPEVAREKYQNVFNPFEKAKLVSQYSGQELANLQGTNELLKQRGQTVQDIVGAGTGAFGASLAGAQGAAQTAQQSYTNLYNVFTQAQQASQFAQQLGMTELQAQLGYQANLAGMQLQKLQQDIQQQQFQAKQQRAQETSAIQQQQWQTQQDESTRQFNEQMSLERYKTSTGSYQEGLQGAFSGNYGEEDPMGLF